MAANPLISSAFLIASGVSSVVNFYSVKFISETYDMSKSLYHILALDSSYTTVMSFLSIGTFLYHALAQDPGPISCTLVMLSSPLIAATVTYLSLLIALIRFKIIYNNLPNGWRPEDQLIQWGHWTLLGVMTFFVALGIANAWFDLKMFHIYNGCMGNDIPTSIYGHITVLAPLIMATGATLIMDFLCWMILRQRNQEQNQDFAPIQDDVPQKATIISAALNIAWIAFTFLVSLALDNAGVTIKFTLGLSFNLILNIVRNPLIARHAFRVNELNQFVDQEEDRERRRQLEINEAAEAKEHRRMRQNASNTGNDEAICTLSETVERRDSLRKLEPSCKGSQAGGNKSGSQVPTNKLSTTKPFKVTSAMPDVAC